MLYTEWVVIEAFGDESGIHKLGYACYGIGAFFFPSDARACIERDLATICARFGLSEELKWNRIGKFRATIEAAVEGLHFLLRSGCGFHAIVVEKDSFRKWKTGDQEEAFYLSYYEFARNLGKRFNEPIDLFIDDRSDRYPHRAEVLQTVTNRALEKVNASGTVSSITKVDSKLHRALQFTDILIGAITSDTNEYLGGKNPINVGKREVILRTAAMLGWDGLRYDTMPNSLFNIWHFPIEFRSRPGTRSIRFDRAS